MVARCWIVHWYLRLQYYSFSDLLFPPSDYTNPDALAWWHSQMDYVLDIGIDGWKCDGTDPFVFELIIAEGYG